MCAGRLAFALGFSLCVAAAGAFAAQVTVLDAKRIYTGNPRQPQVEAIAWDADGKLLAVGSHAALGRQFPGATHVARAQDTLLPGLIDAHGHVMLLGQSLLQANLTGSASKAEILERLQENAKTLAPAQWLQGWGWDQNRWVEKSFPIASDLDAAFPERPVWLSRIDGHAGWANSAALKLAEQKQPKLLDPHWQPDGGHVERDASGKPTGVFVDNAQALVDAAVPAPTEAMRERALQVATQALVAVGLTGMHDMGTSREDFALMRRFADAGKLPLRIDAYAYGEDMLDDLCAMGGNYAHPSGRLEMHGVKLFMDGALGSRGAALLDDYSDDKGNRGLFVTAPADYQQLVAKAKSCHMQVATHAIGDRANRFVLDTYEKTLGADAKTDHRWRVEHAQILSPQDLPRFAQLGIIASMQPTHATSDMPWAQDRLGPQRILGAYAWQSLLKSGAKLAFGSDFPVESPDPRLGLYAAVTRQDAKGNPPGGWFASQRVSREQALAGFTSWAAHAGFDENKVGQLKPGLRADFVVFEGDYFAVPAAQIATLPIESTWVDGRPVYEIDKSPTK